MICQALTLLIIGVIYSVLARDCIPPGVEPQKCNSDCQLPDCACEESEPDVALAERPQIVYLTFDDAFTARAEELYYRGLFNGTYTNPDGCPIRATHFVSARSNDYSLVNQYYYMGHEVGSHSITHRGPPDYFKNLNKTEWVAEIGGMKTMLVNMAEIPEEDIKGMRAPFLQVGGDDQFDMMEELGLQYDCSMPTQEFGYIYMDYGRWPYSLDYYSAELAHACQIEPCPVCSHPNIWVQPMLDLEDMLIGPSGHGYPCAMLDSCLGEENADDVYQMLKKNFDKAYGGYTRAPFGLYLHAAWFFGFDWRYEGYKMFLDEITQLDDVWIVPIEAGLEYRKSPVTNEELLNGTFPAFGCDNFPTPPQPCRPKSCPYEDVYYPEDGMDNTQEYIKVCGFCPENFPWLHNPEGN